MNPSEKVTARNNAISRCKERGIVIPTLAMLREPGRIEAGLQARLPLIDMHAVHPLNLFRIGWHNDPTTGSFGPVNTFEIPSVLTGVDTRIVGLVGAHFPTGAHKVGAAFGCLVPRLVSGEFDPSRHRAVWPSTGNYCRGGVFDSAVLGCKAVAILPEEMSKERFAWLEKMDAEIIATPGCESNVKEIFDACWAIRKADPDAVIFNQFEEFGNYLWHYSVTGAAALEVITAYGQKKTSIAGWVGATGSAGTLAVGDVLKERFPGCTITAVEALQCPTLYACGFGGHRIEGIGDKHVPWIHNVRNTDLIAAIDDEAVIRVFRLFNEPAGQAQLTRRGVTGDVITQLPLLGISGVCNLLAAIKTARWYELDANQVLMTCFTDSSALYQTRLQELNQDRGAYDEVQAQVDFERYLLGTTTDHVRELTYPDRKALHNLKYFTWVEQQGKTVDELDRLWSMAFWKNVQESVKVWDEAITSFNQETGAITRWAKEVL